MQIGVSILLALIGPVISSCRFSSTIQASVMANVAQKTDIGAVAACPPARHTPGEEPLIYSESVAAMEDARFSRSALYTAMVWRRNSVMKTPPISTENKISAAEKYKVN